MFVRRNSSRQLGDVTDPLIWTPGAIDDLKGEVDTQINNLRNDAEDAFLVGTIPQAVYDGVYNFYQQWVAYRNSIGFFAELTGATASRLKNYRETAASWRSQLVSSGAQVSNPAPVTSATPFAGLGNAFGSLPSLAKWLTIGAAVIIGGPIIVKALDLIPKSKGK